MSAPIHGECQPRFAAVREQFAKNFEGVELGAAVAITLDGEPVVDLWGGHVDKEETQEWQRDTLVNVYSTTKGMVALCAHMLVERGQLDVDAPVARYWPEFAAAGKEEIPVRWLLSHQAGLPAVRKPLPPGSVVEWDTMCTAPMSRRSAMASVICSTPSRPLSSTTTSMGRPSAWAFMRSLMSWW